MKKKSVKKRVAKTKKGKKGMIREALLDLNREIANINKEKKRLGDQIKNSDKSLRNFMAFEKELQKRIAALLEREAALKEKKKNIGMREERLSDKLSKVQKIKSELDDI
ncbi:MAG: hypothetical protein ABIH49_00515 [archaeon]